MNKLKVEEVIVRTFDIELIEDLIRVYTDIALFTQSAEDGFFIKALVEEYANNIAKIEQDMDRI